MFMKNTRRRDMETLIYRIRDSVAFISSLIKEVPRMAVILGSGLGALADVLEDPVSVGYERIPGFSRSTVPGHEGKLVFGKFMGIPILVMKGRFHYYEGYDIEKVIFPIRVFHMLGIKNLLITNAAGGVNTGFVPGDLMAVTDHLSFNCPSPLRGPNIDELGSRFPDMSSCYDKELIKIAEGCAKDLGFELKKGIYSFSVGPMFETPAEIRALRTMGADAVGMSTVPEAITANHMGMRTLAISCITNMAAGILKQPLTHEEVISTAKTVEKRFSVLLGEVIRKWE
jgi:purine-nucleoside phosphorylase